MLYKSNYHHHHQHQPAKCHSWLVSWFLMSCCLRTQTVAVVSWFLMSCHLGTQTVAVVSWFLMSCCLRTQTVAVVSWFLMSCHHRTQNVASVLFLVQPSSGSARTQRTALYNHCCEVHRAHLKTWHSTSVCKITMALNKCL